MAQRGLGWGGWAGGRELPALCTCGNQQEIQSTQSRAAAAGSLGTCHT